MLDALESENGLTEPNSSAVYFGIVYPDSREYLAIAKWEWNQSTSYKVQSPYRCLDVVVSMVQVAPSEKNGGSTQTKCPSITYIIDMKTGRREMLDLGDSVNHLAWHFLFETPGGPFGQLHQYAVKLVLPTSSGHMIRSDFLERRMFNSQFAARVAGFSHPRQYFGSVSAKSGLKAFLKAMSSSVGAILLDQKWHQSIIPSLHALELELSNRLSGPFLYPNPIAKKVLVLVDGRRDFTVSAAAEGIFRAAKALDIGLVIVDKPGHWLESSENTHLRDHFLPTDITVDDGLPQRIVQSVRIFGGVVDGIVTFSDRYLCAVAKAAELLGLPTGPTTAFEVCTNKYETRKLAPSTCQFFRISGSDGIEAMLANEELVLHFPMIVKPCSGTTSDGVFKVNNAFELRLAVENASSSKTLTGKYGSGLIVESYIYGPEVDVNLVLVNNEIVFAEISDDFPSPGDADEALLSDTFIDVANVIPSALPPRELDLLLAAAHHMLQQLGFSNGVFHVEARVRNSSMHYTRNNDEDTGAAVSLLDLRPKPQPMVIAQSNSNFAPEVFLVEINARMPGNQETTAIEHAYGIDYYAIYMLSAVAQDQLVKILATPFQNSPQYWFHVLRFHSDKGGIWSSGNACEELILCRPDLRENISYSRCLFRQGQEVPAPLTNVVVFVAYFVLFSRKSRHHLLGVAEAVQKEFFYEVTKV